MAAMIPFLMLLLLFTGFALGLFTGVEMCAEVSDE